MTHANAAAPHMAFAEDGLPAPRRYFAIFALLVTLMLVVLDGAIANVALPTIQMDLHATKSSTVWVVTSYQLVLVMALLPMAFLGEAIGPKRLFVGGLMLFTLASALCASARDMNWLIAARVLQGLGAAPIMSLAIALLRYSLPPRMVGTVIGFNSMVVALSSALGPAIGAAILSVGNWPWLFAVNVPVGLIAMIASVALIGPRGSARKPDLIAMGLNAVAFALLILGAGRVATEAWHGWIMVLLSLATFAMLIRREWHRETPVFPLDLLRQPSFRLSTMTSVCLFAAQMSSFVALPFLFHQGFGLSAIQVGMGMTVWPLTLAVAGPIAGRLADRLNTARLCAIGGVAMACGLGMAAVLSGELVPMLACLMLAGAGFGFVQVPNNRNMLMSVPRPRAAAAGASQGTARLLGQTVGGLTLSIMFAMLPDASVPRMGLTFAACASVLGVLVSLRRAALRD